MNTKIYGLALGALVGGMLASCTNELNEPTFGRVDGNGSVNLVHAPDVVAWSGSQYLDDNTRSNLGTRAGEYANANQWADPNYGGWLVPDPLTDKQKERVRLYFQANPNLDYTDPHWNNFFVQQVYKGYDNPGENSPEIYTSANGTTTSTSDNMNLMTVGQGNVDINNFNSGTCEVNNKVLDNGGNTNDGPFHSDQIMLMVDIDDTSCFGYHETNGSKHHNDKAALVSAAVIDAWAAENGNPGEAVTDKWGRSFLGFDLELRIAEDVLGTTSMKYSNAPGEPNYIKNGDTYTEIKDKNADILYKGQPVYFVDDKMNMYLGEKKSLNDGDYIGEYRDVDNNNQYMGKYMDLAYIFELLDEGWLPVIDKNLREWVKVVGGDGYYSDWIVCLTEGNKINKTPEQPETPENPEQPEICDKCGDPAHNPGQCPNEDCTNEECRPNEPGITTPDDDEADHRHYDEVEVNLSVNDVHMNGDEQKYDYADLWTKLSIHVRKATDVRVLLPIPAKYVVESDDFIIFQTHENPNQSIYKDKTTHGQIESHTTSYTINGWTVDLTVKFYESYPGYPYGCIEIETNGIEQEGLMEYLWETNGDGLNFEIWNYFETGTYKEGQTTVGSDDLTYSSDLTKGRLWNILNSLYRNEFGATTIAFLDEDPSFYINAYGYEWTASGLQGSHNEEINPWDCRVEPIAHEGAFDMLTKYCYHLNDTPWNIIWHHNPLGNVDPKGKNAHQNYAYPEVSVYEIIKKDEKKNN